MNRVLARFVFQRSAVRCCWSAGSLASPPRVQPICSRAGRFSNVPSAPSSGCARCFSTQSLSPELKSRIDQMVKNKKVVVFMKGDANSPKCGFSNAVVQILKMHGVADFDTHDVLASEELRQGIKEYSEWPTIPQVFINGEFVGGCDILLQMHRDGELVAVLKKAGISSTLEENSSS